MEFGAERHSDEEQLEKYALGTISGVELARVEEHLLGCAACRERLESADGYVASMRSAAVAIGKEPAKQTLLMFWRPVLAFAIVAVLAVVFVVRRPGDPVAVRLDAMRGTAEASSAPQGKPLLLTPNVQGMKQTGSLRVQVLTPTGDPVWSGTASGATPQAQVPGLSAGLYLVRLSTSSGELLREFALNVH